MRPRPPPATSSAPVRGPPGALRQSQQRQKSVLLLRLPSGDVGALHDAQGLQAREPHHLLRDERETAPVVESREPRIKRPHLGPVPGPAERRGDDPGRVEGATEPDGPSSGAHVDVLLEAQDIELQPRKGLSIAAEEPAQAPAVHDVVRRHGQPPLHHCPSESIIVCL